ncbi:SUMF1/EgtB/PvdO family nonheme iron enzyme [Sphingomonas sp. CFBP 13603]|uniref:SUMF1/EgtB/PvdO family nonheme iron enzyme n=1 Tax=Sphingomonas sp. CFBP 13603 TaxID=2774040 RepID=UPI00406C8582
MAPFHEAFPYTTPVRVFGANGFGLHNMTGNFWEPISDAFEPARPIRQWCTTASGPANALPRATTKGGAHLCAESYCPRHRPFARQATTGATSHIGFRLESYL